MGLGSDYLPKPGQLQQHEHYDTPKDAILNALAQCEVAGFDEVLIIYNTKDGKSGSYDSGLTASEAGMLCDLFKHWLLNCITGTLQGKKAEVVEQAIFGEENT